MAGKEVTNPSAGQPKTGPVLVIDDEIDLLQTYERLLRRMGCDVVTAERGQEGLSIAQSRKVALVVVDMKLPDIDGLAVLRALRDLRNPPPDALSPIVPRLAQRQVEIEPRLDRTIPTVLADPESLRYVVASFVETAAETMTTVQVTTQRMGEDGARINIGTSRQTLAERTISPEDGLRAVLAEAVVRNFGDH